MLIITIKQGKEKSIAGIRDVDDKADKTLEVAGAPTTTVAGAATVTSIADTATTV